MSLEEISDRLEIQEVLTNYSIAVDRHDWDRFDQVFTEDAHLDYTDISNWQGDREGIKKWLAGAMPTDRRYYHMMGHSQITLHGDTAESVTPCYNPMPRGDDDIAIFGHWYRDKLVRTAEGWRIKDRFFEVGFKYTVPSQKTEH